MHVRKDDLVEVIAGDDAAALKGRPVKVTRVLPDEGKVVVEGVNRVYKHVKPNRRNPQGGRLSKEMPIDASNVMLIDPQTNEATRVGIRYQADGTKELYAKKSGATLRRIGPPRKAYAKKS